MAVRAALSAAPQSALRLILAHNARLAATGTAVGLAATWPAARWMQAQLPGFDASLLWPCMLVGLGVLALAQLASLIPVRRAARTDITLALHAA